MVFDVGAIEETNVSGSFPADATNLFSRQIKCARLQVLLVQHGHVAPVHAMLKAVPDAEKRPQRQVTARLYNAGERHEDVALDDLPARRKDVYAGATIPQNAVELRE